MKIYFACSITGGREDENIYQQLVGVILSLGGEVPSAHIANNGIEELDGKVAPERKVRRLEGRRAFSWGKDTSILPGKTSHNIELRIGNIVF